MPLRHIPRDVSRVIRGALGIPRKSYWERRKSYRYMRATRNLVDGLAAEADSILDVGSNGCAYLDWFPQIARRVSLDIDNPYSGHGVEGIKADFFVWEPTERFDIVLCLQVLEHIPDARTFAQRLLACGRRHVVVSVPYKWAADRSPYHVHDPVDEAKMTSWFGCQPTYSHIARERNGTERMICHYVRAMA